MATDHKKKEKNPNMRKKKSFSCFTVSCSDGFPVSDSDSTTREAPSRRPAKSSAGSSSKRRLLLWFFWSRFRKKAKTGAPSTPAKESTSENGDGGNRTDKHELVQSTPPQIAIKTKLNPTSSVTRTRNPDRQQNAVRARHGPRSAQTGTFTTWVGLWFMVVSLALMVFSGQATALICFFSCLYLLPNYIDPNSRHEMVESRSEVEMDSNEYKKKVVLEGLLERRGRRPSIGTSRRK